MQALEFIYEFYTNTNNHKLYTYYRRRWLPSQGRWLSAATTKATQRGLKGLVIAFVHIWFYDSPQRRAPQPSVVKVGASHATQRLCEGKGPAACELSALKLSFLGTLRLAAPSRHCYLSPAPFHSTSFRNIAPPLLAAPPAPVPYLVVDAWHLPEAPRVVAHDEAALPPKLNVHQPARLEPAAGGA